MAYDQFNPLAELGQLYGTGPTEMVPTGQQDPNAMVNELLKSLEMAQPPQMQQPKTWQNVLGSLSDALLQYSTVRGGGAPMPAGPYASRRIHARQQQAQMAREAESQNREMRNRVRIGTFEESLRAKREKELAEIKAKNMKPRQFSRFIQGPNGQPIAVNVTTDPMTGELMNIEQFGEQYVRPNTMAGTFEGREVMVNIDPVTNRATIVSAGGGGGDIGPKAPGEEKDAIDSAFVLLNKIGTAGGMAQTERGTGGSFIGKLGQQGLRAMPGGAQVLGRFDPNSENIASVLKDIESVMQLLRTGKVANEVELVRLRGIAPQLADTTQPEVFLQKLNNFKRETQIRLRNKMERNPALFTPEQRDSVEGVGGEAPTLDEPADAASYGASILKRLREEGQ